MPQQSERFVVAFALPIPLPFFYGWNVLPNSVGVPPAGLTSAGGNLKVVRLTALSMISITSTYLCESRPVLPLWVNRAMRCHLRIWVIHLVLKEMATFGQISST